VPPHLPDDDQDRWQRLLREAQAGSQKALGELLEGSRRQLLHAANRALPDELRAKAEASDLVQDTFLEAHQSFRFFRGQTYEDLLGWLRRILHNNCLNFVRDYRDRGKREVSREIPLPGEGERQGAEPLVADDPSPSSDAGHREDADALRQAIARLPPHYREVIQLRHFDGLSFAEVARRMGYSEEAARKIWSRALERLTREGGAPRGV
jgi:RNA polymerase sigma-70 factor (ECF subfamily)